MIGTLLFLPFRIAFNLFRLAVRLVLGAAWIPIHLVTRHLFATFIIVAAVIVLAMCKGKQEEKAENALPKSTAPAVTVAPQLQGAKVANKKAAPVRIDPVLKVEDGNSAFSKDLYAAMTDAERTYYSQLFYWVMNTMLDGKAYNWAQGNIHGTLEPTKTFDNRLGGTCRNFKETLKVHTVQQTMTGIACYQGNGTWCKLKANATPMCGLGGKASTTESIKRSLQNLF